MSVRGSIADQVELLPDKFSDLSYMLKRNVAERYNGCWAWADSALAPVLQTA